MVVLTFVTEMSTHFAALHMHMFILQGAYKVRILNFAIMVATYIYVCTKCSYVHT